MSAPALSLSGRTLRSMGAWLVAAAFPTLFYAYLQWLVAAPATGGLWAIHYWTALWLGGIGAGLGLASSLALWSLPPLGYVEGRWKGVAAGAAGLALLWLGATGAHLAAAGMRLWPEDGHTEGWRFRFHLIFYLSLYLGPAALLGGALTGGWWRGLPPPSGRGRGPVLILAFGLALAAGVALFVLWRTRMIHRP